MCLSGEDAYYDVTTIHAFALQNVLRPFHNLLPEFQSGFKVLQSDADLYKNKANELIQTYLLNSFAFDEFEKIQRHLDGSLSGTQVLPSALQIEWCSWLDQNAFLTLNDIVYQSGRLITTYHHIASGLASRFAWILVDEFQDSSPGQILILKEIHKFHRTTFFCVGDPNQSIYRFAGAEPQLLIDFANHVEANGNHRLTGNFRSSENIVVYAQRLQPLSPMQAIGEYANHPLVPTHRSVNDAADGIFNYFLPEVDKLGIPLGEVAIIASWWTSLYHLAKQLRARNIPAIGPGARPYKRSNLLAQLVESMGAYLESPEPEIAVAVHRALFILLANLTTSPPHTTFDYKGRITVCKLLAEAQSVRRTSTSAVDWLGEAAERFANILIDEELIPQMAANVIQQCASQMITEIQATEARDRGNALTVEDLGIFARPKKCIHLLTVHKAKGREFEAVAIIESLQPTGAHDPGMAGASVSASEGRSR